MTRASIFLFAAAAFLPSLRGGFVWDDHANLTHTLAWRGLSPEHLAWMAGAFHLGHWHPLTWLSLAIDHAVWGLRPPGFHLTSVLLHGANTVLLYHLIIAVLRFDPADAIARWTAAAGALFWGLHPLRTESVAWITERRDLLSCFFLLLTVLAYLRGRYAPSLLFYALSLLCKAWGMTLPVVLLLLDAWTGRRVWREKIPFTLMATASAAVTLASVGGSGAMPAVAHHGIAARVVQSLWGLGFYVAKTVWPVGLSPLYALDRRTDLWSSPFLVPALVTLAAMVALVVWRRRCPGVATACAAYVVIVSPVLGIAQAGPQLAADRYTYLATIPLVVLATAGLARLRTARVAALTRRAAAALVVCLLGVLGLASWRMSEVWRSDLTLWSRVLARDPANAAALSARGMCRFSAGDVRGALADLNGALRIEPRDALALAGRGIVLARLGRHVDAALDLDRAVAHAPPRKRPRILTLRGCARLGRGDAAGAERDFDESLALGAAGFDNHFNRGLARMRLHRPEDAVRDFDAALTFDPGHRAALDARDRARGLANESDLDWITQP
jgi:hypothetical protein